MFVFLLSFVIIEELIAKNNSGHWDYGHGNGQETWEETCLNGLRQSPIDIRAVDIDYTQLDRIQFTHYDTAGRINITNNGHTVMLDGFENWGTQQPYIEGGGLKYRYNLVQFHLHWSQHDHDGSEHMIAGLHYPAEVHMVHIRQDLPFEEALEKSDGVAVLSVFIVIGNGSSSFDAISSAFEDVIYPGNQSTVEGIRPSVLLPAHTDAFYRYEGSLTTPGCNEAVVWTVFSEPISMTRSQMNDMRQVESDEGDRLLHNVRTTQPLNGRRVLYMSSSFDEKLLCSGNLGVRIIITLIINIVFCACQLFD